MDWKPDTMRNNIIILYYIIWCNNNNHYCCVFDPEKTGTGFHSRNEAGAAAAPTDGFAYIPNIIIIIILRNRREYLNTIIYTKMHNKRDADEFHEQLIYALLLLLFKV